MQTELPFKLEGNTASRKKVRELATSADGLYKLDISQIEIRPNFNKRRNNLNLSKELYEQQLLIPSLAEAIFNNNGPDTPLLGDFYELDNTFYITNGERRYRALWHLLNTDRGTYPNGQPVNMVKVLLNPADTTDIERKKKVITTQDNLKLTPIELAYAYKSFKDEDNLTNEQIADMFKVSRQTIDNYIIATQLSSEIQDKINIGDLSLTAALKEYREEHAKPKNRNLSVIDEESGEVILTEFQEKDLKELAEQKDKIRGDEDEFIQEDNSITRAGSKGGAKEEGSGAVVIGKESIYMDSQKLALWKQMIHRFRHLEQEIILGSTLDNGNLANVDDILAERLKNEYNLTVK